MPKAKTIIELSEDWHLDEPLAYLVKCFNTDLWEYRVFDAETKARRYAETQLDLSRDAGEPQDFLIYPLYAGNGRRLTERRFS